MTHRKIISCQIITEGLIGTENQCVGVAQALGLEPKIIRIRLKQPWKMLSPYLGYESANIFEPQPKEPWPDLLITSGRKSIAASRFIKNQSGGKTKTLHIQDPKIAPHHFDLVAVPKHDPLRGDNVIVTHAAPNKITPELLNSAKKEFHFFDKLKSPRIAVLIGGNSKAYKMTREITLELVQQLQHVQGSLMITCSRRTGSENEAVIREHLKSENIYIWNGQGQNPYPGLLAWADYILVTADSVSMLSEACTTGKPVYMIDLKGGSKRISLLHNELMRLGALRKFCGSLKDFTYEPLNDSKFIADEVKKRFNLFTD